MGGVNDPIVCERSFKVWLARSPSHSMAYGLTGTVLEELRGYIVIVELLTQIYIIIIIMPSVQCLGENGASS